MANDSQQVIIYLHVKVIVELPHELLARLGPLAKRTIRNLRIRASQVVEVLTQDAEIVLVFRQPVLSERHRLQHVHVLGSHHEIVILLMLREIHSG